MRSSPPAPRLFLNPLATLREVRALGQKLYLVRCPTPHHGMISSKWRIPPEPLRNPEVLDRPASLAHSQIERFKRAGLVGLSPWELSTPKICWNHDGQRQHWSPKAERETGRNPADFRRWLETQFQQTTTTAGPMIEQIQGNEVFVFRSLLPYRIQAIYRQYLTDLRKNGFLSLDRENPGHWRTYNDEVCQVLHALLTPTIELTINRKLQMTYCYSTTYMPGSCLRTHTDRPQCEYTLSICLENQDPQWPLYFDLGDRTVHSVMSSGDATFLLGRKFPHWRNQLTDETPYIGLFLHWIDPFKKAPNPMLHLHE